MNATYSFIHQAEQLVMVVRQITTVQKLPECIGQCIMHIAQYLDEMGEPPAGAPFVAYHNMDMEALDVEIGFPVARALVGRGGIQPGMIAECDAATCLYTGSYPNMAPAYEELNRRMVEKGREATGVAYEFYLNSPAEVPSEALQTLIFFPLK